MQESDVKCGVGIGWRSWSCVRAGARANEPFRKVGEEEEEEKEERDFIEPQQTLKKKKLVVGGGNTSPRCLPRQQQTALKSD